MTLSSIPVIASPSAAVGDYPVQPVPFTKVQLTDEFWAPRIETNRAVTIPFAFEQCEKNQRMYNFERAAAAIRGETVTDKKASEFSFDDTDPYKVIEGASYAMSVKPDPALDEYVDQLIEKIAAAQEPDGYLFTPRTFAPEAPHVWAGEKRWVLERELSHELYNLGHLYEAAVAHYQATGKRSLLDVAIKTADLLVRTFGPDKEAIWPGHQITEMGLAKLYRVTGEEKYLQLAKFLLDVRGPDGFPGSGKEYNQSQEPVIEQREAVGHAVRATYMYAGMADVAAMTNDQSYITAIDAIWENTVSKKLYITGGIGAKQSGEAFGQNYELPNMTAYNETCAAIGNVYWNHRLFLLHGDAKYIDVLERSLYNGLISGVALDGKSFFYPNPLESKGQHARSPWFGCACCPSNVCRFMASVPGYVYAQRNEEIFVNLFVSGVGQLETASGQTVELRQETNYPWEGQVKITVNPKSAASFTLNVRIPGWSQNRPVPSDLYKFEDEAQEPVTIKVNGKAVPLETSLGYVNLQRAWQPGDVVEVNLPMSARRVIANEHVHADLGRVAFERGPLVYCFEWPDNPDAHVRSLLVEDNAPVQVVASPDLLGGVVALKTKGTSFTEDISGNRASKEVEPLAIPYYAWANRGKGDMAVWIAREESAVHASVPKTIAATADITSSHGHPPATIADSVTLAARGEERGEGFNWWPKKGTVEWIEYSFNEPEQISETSVYWFDDIARGGGCAIPKAWQLFFKDTSAGDTGAWRPVIPVQGSVYGTALEEFNTFQFEPVTTTALRLEVTLQEGLCGGVEEWSVR